ncbi:MAG TPA: TlpA disulfide reductase family protein [Bryobacteraceae bacterium]|jgi:thiol-disulfide isomerase/thioredoxin|nr:TlpA disulfide reductase family protein [Bryobacteraceae bacterium]
MPQLLAFFQSDCPTCRLIVPYLNALAKASVPVTGISQDPYEQTCEFVRQTGVAFPVEQDICLERSKRFDLVTVPSLVVLDDAGVVQRIEPGFDKQAVNEIAAYFGAAPVATPYDGFPASKPGCSSRHLEIVAEGEAAPALDAFSQHGVAALELDVEGSEDLIEYCFRTFHDALPVVPPTRERIGRMLRATALDPLTVIGRIPPCYGEATVEKIAANAVMAGCVPEMMRVLIPLVRAVCDERFNAHGVQATTQFAAPLIVMNGPIRAELGFHSRQNFFSNVARSNSTVGRALQLILLNLGGARPQTIDMSTMGNAGKFSFCIVENEEESPWEPLHVELGFKPEESTLTLFAAGSPHGIAEQAARTARGVLKTITYSLATNWSYRSCRSVEVFLILAPEHVKTIHRDGWSKQDVRSFLFENTGVPLRYYRDDEPGEGVKARDTYKEIVIDGEHCYQKFNSPDAIKIIVAGGTAGKFSAMMQGWQSGPRGSQMVTYPIP